MAAADEPLPIALLPVGWSCLVVGGGRIACRKASSILEAGGIVTMVAPSFCEEASMLPVRRVARSYRAGEAGEYRLVVTATGDPLVDGAVYEDAEGAGVLVNAADDPAHCNFYLPAVHRAGSVSVAVSTGGRSPALASWLRSRIATLIGADVALLAERVGAVRDELRARGLTSEGRDWTALIEQLRTCSDPEESARSWLKGQSDTPQHPGSG